MPRTMLAATTAVYLLTTAGAACAQESAPQGARADDGGTTLGEVVVTAQRRSENLQNVPISITALNASALKQKGIVTTEDLTQVVPGLLWGRSTNFNQPAIRGVGTRNASAGDEPNIATYLDGVYQPESLTALQELANVERIEVLKGPQGTLYGRNATGGAISIITADPTFTPKINVAGTLGGFNYRKLSGVVSGPIIADKLAASIAAVRFSDDGYIHNNFLNVTQGASSGTVVRPKLLFTPDDKIKIELNGLYSRGKSNVLISSYSLGGNNVVENPATINNPVLNPGRLPPSGLVASQPYTTAGSIIPTAKVTQRLVDLHGSYDLGFATLSATLANGFIRAFNDSLTDASGIGIARTIYYPKNNYFDEEAVLTSTGTGPLTWLVGAQGFQGKAAFSPLLSGSRNATTGQYTYANILYGQRTRSWAVFAEATWNPLDKLYLTGGARYSSDKKAAFNQTNTAALVADEHSWHNFAPRGVIRYQFAPDSNVYASITKGYKSGTYNAVSLTAGKLVPVSPELITSYEVGIKSDINRRLRLSAAAYHYDYKNLQVSAAVTVIVNGSPTSLTNLQNAGKVSINGGEASAEFAVTHDLTLNAGVSLLHTKISDFPNAALNVPSTSLTAPFGNTAVIRSVNGNELIRAPKSTFNIGGSYKHELLSGELTLNANAFFSAKYFAELGNRVVQPHYEIVNASATWRSPDTHYYVTVFGENLTNQVYAVGHLITTSSDATQAAKPRWYGVTFGVDF
jgi:iron complex outermembrane receptor protein